MAAEEAVPAEPVLPEDAAAPSRPFSRLGLVVALQEDGTLRGTTNEIDPRSFKLVRVPNVTISFAKLAPNSVATATQFESSQAVVAEATSDKNGEFTVKLPANEAYTAVARASKASAVLNLYVLSNAASARESDDVAVSKIPVHFASQVDGTTESFDIVLIPEQQEFVVGPEPQDDGGVPLPLPPGGGVPGGGFAGGGGGFGGGGGGFGGGGGLGIGGALGIAGLAAGIVGLADDNNNASPFVP